MASKKKATAPKVKPKKRASWAKNAKDYVEKQKSKGKGKNPLNQEDRLVGGRYSRSKRIVDNGQKPPKGYMRTGGRYFAKIANMRYIRSQTTPQQRAMWKANEDALLGADRKGGYVGSAANQGMYNGDTSEINFRKTQGARKMIDKNGGTYSPEYYKYFNRDGTVKNPGQGKYKKSRYIMAIGQDGHMR